MTPGPDGGESGGSRLLRARCRCRSSWPRPNPQGHHQRSGHAGGGEGVLDGLVRLVPERQDDRVWLTARPRRSRSAWTSRSSAARKRRGTRDWGRSVGHQLPASAVPVGGGEPERGVPGSAVCYHLRRQAALANSWMRCALVLLAVIVLSVAPGEAAESARSVAARPRRPPTRQVGPDGPN